MLKTEYHKGVAIRVIKDVIGNGTPEVVAKFQLKGKGHVYKGTTKDNAVVKAKQAIDRII